MRDKRVRIAILIGLLMMAGAPRQHTADLFYETHCDEWTGFRWWFEQCWWFLP